MARRLLSLAFIFVGATIVALGQISPHGPVKFDCQTCHMTDSWEMRKDDGFDHGTTGFALIGRHKSLDCASCHDGLKFTSQSTKCLSCHTDIHKSELGENCMRCHTTVSWRITDMIQRHQQTRFPLVGKHLTLNCEACHANIASHQYSGTATTCIGCHRVDFQASQNPNHTTAGFSTECSGCHRVTAFTWGQGFDHDLTAFPLVGAHRAVACASCHQNGRFKGTPMQCSSCHREEYASSRNPNHAMAGFTMECQTCHTVAGWTGGRYDHTALTLFPLTGAHIQLQCSNCHGDNIFVGRSVDCVSCHQAALAGTHSPNHASSGFPQQCALCHSTMSWIPSSFNHSTSQFPLTGAHQAVVCAQCHVNNQYQGLTTNCYDCHTQDFNTVASPNHITGNFSHTCTQCHTTTTWTPSTFNHSTTLFPLTGAHIATTCQGCHINGNYQLHYTDCYQCHQTDFQQTTNPNHVAGNFSHDCTQCHSTMAWSPATFNHSTTLFPLTGAHTSTPCQSCHVNGNYQLHYTDCYQCHQSDYQQVTNPNHVTQQFAHNCTQCHSTSVWTPNTMSHDSRWFRIYSGRHRNEWTQCSECHTTPGNLTSFSCIDCHEHQRSNVDPRHTGVSNYIYSSPACYSCHRNA